MAITTVSYLKKLYEVDDYLWIQETIKLLQENKLNELDLENLIEELGDLGNEKRHKVESLLEQIIRHLLLLQYWHNEYNNNYRHWQSEIISFRTQINKRMTKNFYNYLNEQLPEIYEDAKFYVSKKSGLDTFPLQCPYNLDQLLNKYWFPV